VGAGFGVGEGKCDRTLGSKKLETDNQLSQDGESSGKKNFRGHVALAKVSIKGIRSCGRRGGPF
jgi:hypothetical protein